MNSGAGAQPAIARVLLDTRLPQLDHLFDYAVPEVLLAEIQVGQRVRVPFRSGGRKAFGWVIELVHESTFDGNLSHVSEIVSPIPMLNMHVWELVRAVSDRAAGSAGDILRLAIPQRHVRAEKAYLKARDQSGTESNSGDVQSDTSEDVRSIASLLISGERLAFSESHSPVRLDSGEWVGGWTTRMVDTAKSVLAAGESVIICVPDYRDLDQLRDAFGTTPVLRVDAKQPGAERYSEFLAALEDTPRIIIGNRSAIYAPAFNLGAILIWDDGDPVLGEPRAPYVHCRDAALIRAQQSSCGLMFFAHSRSAEVQRLIDIEYVKPQSNLPKRVRVRHADQAAAPDVFAGRLPGFAISMMNEGLRTGPVLVQVAQPGYAPVAVCESCSNLAHCAHCGGPIGFRQAKSPACRWCGKPVTRWKCSHCGEHTLVERGSGSQRTAEQFSMQFPHTRILVSDIDHPRERVDARPALVVATVGAEPIAAGGYRAVVLLDAERLLSRPTLRAGEDCLRWWENAAAKSAPDGVCLLASGAGPVVDAFVSGHTTAWLRSELRDRAQLLYPPAVRVASVTGTARQVTRALDVLAGVRQLDVLGPAPFAAGQVRAILRFGYGVGDEVARKLRGLLVTEAAGSQSPVRGGSTRKSTLKLKFDDRTVFDQFGESREGTRD